MRRRLVTWGALFGLLAVILGGLGTYVAGSHDLPSKRDIVEAALLLVSVLVGAAIALEAGHNGRGGGGPPQAP